MSDEGLMNLEDDDGAPAAADAVAETPVETPPEPEAPPEAQPAEVEAVEVAGKKYVPLAGVISERKARQDAEKTAKEARERAQQIEAQYAQIAPFADILRQNPDLLKPRPTEAPPPASDAVDPDLVELAQTLDLYDPTTGKPDTGKAAKIAGVMEKRATSKAQQAVAPFQQEALQAKLQQNYAAAVQMKGPNGDPINKAILDDLWRQAAQEPGGLQTLADPRSVSALALMALGAQHLTSKPAVQAPAQAPLVSEPSGGTPRARPYLSALEESVAKNKGIAPSKWAENLKGYTKGGENVLED